VPKLPTRIKPKAGRKASPAERRHHMAVMAYGCLVCGRDAVAHHILQDSPSKVGRRDHSLVVPLCSVHHAELHDTFGDELAWQKKHGLNLANEAEFYRAESVMGGIL